MLTIKDLPTYRELLWPVLTAVRRLGDSASVREVFTEVCRHEAFPAEMQALHYSNQKKASTPVLYDRVTWACSYLGGMGLLENSRRGVWASTAAGRSAEQADLGPLHDTYRTEVSRRRKEKTGPAATEVASGNGLPEAGEATANWREEVLAELAKISPAAFERLAQRLLREAGFINTEVTGKPKDGGIDGHGRYQLSLITFLVFFQAKRYQGTVGVTAVRDFRGAMSGRGDRGLMITTGTFTSDALAEATRHGAIPIDLIDGYRLCDLLKEHGLGVTTIVRQVEDIRIEKAFFAGLDSTVPRLPRPAPST